MYSDRLRCLGSDHKRYKSTLGFRVSSHLVTPQRGLCNLSLLGHTHHSETTYDYRVVGNKVLQARWIVTDLRWFFLPKNVLLQWVGRSSPKTRLEVFGLFASFWLHFWPNHQSSAYIVS